MTEPILWLSHNQECWYKRLKRSLQIYDNSTPRTNLCDCMEECPAHPKNRLVHIGDRCIHADGTHHRIKPKLILTESNFLIN